MLRSALSCAALILLASCGPKKVESPLEKAPPAEIAQARALASSGDVRGAQNAYETFIINHPGTVEADLARLELGVLGSDIGRCQSAIPHFEQAQDSADRAIALRASLHLGACQLQLGDPERALRTVEPLAGERFSSEEQALLWDTTVIASEQTTSAASALRVFDTLLERGGAPPDPLRVDAVVDLLVQKLTIEETAVLFDELRAGALPHVAVSMRLLNHALDTQDAELIVRTSDALRASDSIEDPEVTILVARADEFLHGNPYVVGALLPLTGRGREVGRQLLQGMQLAALDEGGPELVVEDTAGDPSKATAAVESLIGDQRVVAVLGPVASRTTEAAAESTRRAGVPLLSFSASEETTSAGEQVFRFLYSPRDELTALVGKARARGLSRFVILYPDHGYGRTMERLFDQEVAAAGGVYCEGVPYPPGTKSFVEYVRDRPRNDLRRRALRRRGRPSGADRPDLRRRGRVEHRRPRPTRARRATGALSSPEPELVVQARRPSATLPSGRPRRTALLRSLRSQPQSALSHSLRNPIRHGAADVRGLRVRRVSHDFRDTAPGEPNPSGAHRSADERF